MTDIKKYNLLIVMLIISSAITTGVQSFVSFAGSGAWLLSVLCTVIALLVYPRLFSSAAMTEFGRDSGVFKMILCCLAAVIAVCYGASLAACFADNITSAFLTKTPRWYILTLIVLPSGFGCWFGTKSVSRYAGVVAVVGIVIIAGVLVMCIGEYSLLNLYPFFGTGISGMSAGLVNICIFAPLIFYYILLCNCNCKKRSGVRLNVTKIVLLSGVVISCICLGTNLLLTYSAAGMTSMPLYTLAASVRGNYLIERSESVIILLWLFAAFISISGISAITTLVCTTAFSLDNRNALTASFCGCIFALALIISRYNLSDSALDIFSLVLGVLSFVFPILVNIRHRLRRR